MTKEEYIADAMPFGMWSVNHAKYVENALTGLREYFDVERFVEDHKDKACKDVIECILADAYENNNCSLYELENDIGRLLYISFEEIVDYRTEKFWEEIA